MINKFPPMIEMAAMLLNITGKHTVRIEKKDTLIYVKRIDDKIYSRYSPSQHEARERLSELIKEAYTWLK